MKTILKQLAKIIQTSDTESLLMLVLIVVTWSYLGYMILSLLQ
jgi:uncharacterized protein with PQ loop repeat